MNDPAPAQGTGGGAAVPPQATRASLAAQARILAWGTWRLAWREPLTRLLLGLALLLAVVGAIAAIGSPGSGNGAIQMLAVCLQIVPFAVVLLAGDVWRRDPDEAAILARPVDALTYVLGRGTGLCLVGLGLLGAVAAVSVLGLWLVARLPLLPDVGWVAILSAAYVAPGFLLLSGACLWVLARGGAGPRYHAAVIAGALLVAFYDYRLDALAGHVRALAFFAPFPGFLTLGLALPAPLLGAAPLPGWLVANRVLFALLGLGLLLLSARRRSVGFPRMPMRRLRVWRLLLAATGGGALAAAIPLALAVGRLAPAVMPAAPTLAGTPAPRVSALTIAASADAGTGRLRGTAAWTVAAGGDLAVLLNAGLRLTAPALITEPYGSALVPGTAARLYRVTLPAGGVLPLRFSGRLLPVPSAIPYPPFPLGTAFEGAALGAGRAFFDGRGTWYPLLVGPGLRPIPPDRVTLHLAVTGAAGPWVGVSTADYRGPALPPVLGAAAPYRSYTGPGWRLLADARPPAAERAVLATYARAAALLAPVLAGDFASGSTATFAVSPLLTRPLLSAAVIWIPGGQPFCVPPDAVAGTCGGAAPSLRAATLLLAELAWRARLELAGGNLALPPRAGAAEAQLGPQAAFAAWVALGQDAALVAALQGTGALPVLGTLSPAERQTALALIAADAAAPPGSPAGGSAGGGAP